MEAQEGTDPMLMFALVHPVPPERYQMSQVSMLASRQPPMAQEPPQMPKEMAANAKPVHPELCRVSPIQISTSQCPPMPHYHRETSEFS